MGAVEVVGRLSPFVGEVEAEAGRRWKGTTWAGEGAVVVGGCCVRCRWPGGRVEAVGRSGRCARAAVEGGVASGLRVLSGGEVVVAGGLRGGRWSCVRVEEGGHRRVLGAVVGLRLSFWRAAGEGDCGCRRTVVGRRRREMGPRRAPLAVARVAVGRGLRWIPRGCVRAGLERICRRRREVEVRGNETAGEVMVREGELEILNAPGRLSGLAEMEAVLEVVHDSKHLRRCVEGLKLLPEAAVEPPSLCGRSSRL